MTDTQTDFERFADTLAGRERAVFLGSVPFFLALVGGADGEYDLPEMDASAEVLLATVDTLGPAFRRSPEAEEAFAAMRTWVHEPDKLEFHGRLMTLRDVLQTMPGELADAYRAFVRDACLRVATASGVAPARQRRGARRPAPRRRRPGVPQRRPPRAPPRRRLSAQ